MPPTRSSTGSARPASRRVGRWRCCRLSSPEPYRLLRARTLRGHRGALLAGQLGVQVGPRDAQLLVERAGGPQVVVEVVAQRDAGRDVQAADLVVPDAVEVLDEGPQRIAVRRDQDDVPAPKIGDDA